MSRPQRGPVKISDGMCEIDFSVIDKRLEMVGAYDDWSVKFMVTAMVMVGGQEDMIVDVAYEMSQNKK